MCELIFKPFACVILPSADGSKDKRFKNEVIKYVFVVRPSPDGHHDTSKNIFYYFIQLIHIIHTTGLDNENSADGYPVSVQINNIKTKGKNNMPTNRVSATLSTTDLLDITNAITTINSKLPFLITLTYDERKSLPKLGDKTLAFVTKSLELANQRPDILPGNLSVAEFGKDVTLYTQLYSVIQSLTLLMEKLEDTQVIAGSEAYSAALIVYQTAKISGADLGGLEAVLDDLAKRFAKKTTGSGNATAPSQS